MTAKQGIYGTLLCVGLLFGSMAYYTRHVGAQTGVQTITCTSGACALDPNYQGGNLTLSANVTSITIPAPTRAAQQYILRVCQPTGATYTVSGISSIMVGDTTPPATAGACVVYAMVGDPVGGTWAINQQGKVPVTPAQLATTLAPYALSSAIPTTMPFTSITGVPAYQAASQVSALIAANAPGFITAAQAPVQSVNGLTGAVVLSIPAAIPSYTSPAMTTTGLVQYQTVTSSMSAAVTTTQAFECGVIGGGANTPKLTAVGYVTTTGTLTFALTNQALATLSATPTMNAVCKPLN